MQSKHRKSIIKFAKDKKYKYFSQMVYILHVNENRSPRAISDWAMEETGKLFISYDLCLQMIKRNGWKNKKAKYDPPKAGKDAIGIEKCKRCHTYPIAVERGFVYLCSKCHGDASRYGGGLEVENRAGFMGNMTSYGQLT